MTGNPAVTAVLSISLRSLENGLLAALNLMINGFGKATIGTRAYRIALELGLIKEDGTPETEELVDALAYEVNRRVDAGEFR